MARAISDNNGFIEIRDNKLSKPGVFQYLGSEIGAPEPEKIYNVYRPEEELNNPECIQSFKLQPWVIDHKMLGKKFDTAAEDKGIHGVIGQDVYFDQKDKWLKGNLKIFSDQLERDIDFGKNELSLGFTCDYKIGKTGSYNGKPYNVVQTNIRGNHLALVDDSRMNVAVMDSKVSTGMDSMKVTIKPFGENEMKDKSGGKEENKPSNGQDADMTMADMMSMMKEIMPMIKMMNEMMASMNGNYTMGGDEYKVDGMDADKDEDKENGMDEDKDEDKEKESGMDQAAIAKTITSAVDNAIKPLAEKIKTLEGKANAMDSGALLDEISKRDELADNLSQHIGTFDHQSKTLQQVAEIGAEKLSVPCDKGQELPALRAYLHNRAAPSQQKLYAVQASGEDSKAVDNPVDSYINGGSK